MINLWLVGEIWRRNSMNLLVRSHGGAVCDGHNSMNLLSKDCILKV